jgi:alanine dehydrogenase
VRLRIRSPLCGGGVVYSCVATTSGAVARTLTMALSSATLPYVVRLADLGVVGAAWPNAALGKGLTALNGQLVPSPVAAAHELSFTDVVELMADEGKRHGA